MKHSLIVVVVLAVASCARPNPAYQAETGSTEPTTSDGGRTTSGTAPPSSSGPSSADGTTARPPATETGDPPDTTDAPETTDSPPSTTSGVGTEETGTEPAQDCCESHTEPGCDDPAVEECVCAIDSFCCNPKGVWDSLCASWADGCGADCGFAEDCCELSATPGCGHQAIDEECVCAAKGGEDCCLVEWGPNCSALAASQCNVECPSAGNCCIPHGTPGCSVPSIEECVCVDLRMGECCAVEWSDDCFAAATEACAVACPIGAP